MSSIIQEQPADVVVMGLGVMSGTIAAELSIAGYKVAGVTRGPYWDYATDFSILKYDEWGVGLNRKFDFPLPMQSSTIRNSSTQFALPVRRYTMPIQYHALGHGVGGAAHHYGGTMGRQGPWSYTMKSSTASKYGAGFLASINPNDDTQDWPLTYAEYEPYYVAWEAAMGLCGTNNGLNVMSKNYPMPPHPLTAIAQSFQTATQALGYSPYPHVSSLASEAYVNSYGVQVNGCVYDGWCGASCNYACEVGAKANSAYRTIPAAIKTGKFSMALNSHIFRMDTDPTTGLVTDIRYYDSAGDIHVQPGKVFFNGLWGYNQVRSMLLSGVGNAYNPSTVTGSVGRGLTYGYGPYTSTSGPSATFPIGGNSYPAGNGSGGGVDLYDFMDDNFDHTGLNFIGGSQLSVGTYAGGGPGNVTFAGGVGAGSMGSTFKATQKGKYAHTTTAAGLGGTGPDLPTTTHMWDLDPTYTDVWGDPVARTTHDWTANPYNVATWFAQGGMSAMVAILTKMGAASANINTKITPVPALAAHTDWWGHHWRGGNRIGTDPATSVWNKWNQSWTAPNLFAAGEVTNTTGDSIPSGTHAAGPQVQVASEGIQKYLSSPGLLS